MVVEGKLVKGCGIQVLRKGKIAYTGQLDSLRRVKEIVKEVCNTPCTSFCVIKGGKVVRIPSPIQL